jgi:hypothetical protein
LGVTEGIDITNQKDLIKNIIQECDCPFLFFFITATFLRSHILAQLAESLHNLGYRPLLLGEPMDQEKA